MLRNVDISRQISKYASHYGTRNGLMINDSDT